MHDLMILRQNLIRLAVLGAYLGGLVWLGYATQRADFTRLVALYAVLFGLYLFICYSGYFKSEVKTLLGAALLLRLGLLFMQPNLTNDYFRYIWDGLLVAGGQNPYQWTPSELMALPQALPGINATLYGQLNSPQFYSAYPPFTQLLFGTTAWLAGGSVFGNIILLRVIMLLAEFGTIILMYRLATTFNLPRTAVYLYAFNPLVILELTGNLHLEAVMIFFLLLAFYLLTAGRQGASALSLALAAGTKLVPLIFLPFLIKRLGMKKSLAYFSITGAVLLLLSLPFLGGGAPAHFFSSLGLFYRVLQFNSPIYSFFLWIGYENISASKLALMQVLLPALGFVGIIVLALRERAASWQGLFTVLTLALTIYLLTSANVHAWYLAPLVALSVFTRFRFAIAWSFLIIFTYAAYRTLPYSESLWLVLAEYLLVGGCLIYELLPGRRPILGAAVET